MDRRKVVSRKGAFRVESRTESRPTAISMITTTKIAINKYEP